MKDSTCVFLWILLIISGILIFKIDKENQLILLVISDVIAYVLGLVFLGTDADNFRKKEIVLFLLIVIYTFIEAFNLPIKNFQDYLTMRTIGGSILSVLFLFFRF